MNTELAGTRPVTRSEAAASQPALGPRHIGFSRLTAFERLHRDSYVTSAPPAAGRDRSITTPLALEECERRRPAKRTQLTTRRAGSWRSAAAASMADRIDLPTASATGAGNALPT